MADEELELENEGGETTEDGGKKKKTLLFIIIGAVLLVALTAGGTFFVVSSMTGSGSDAEEVEEKEVEPDGPAIYIALEPEFVVSYQVGSRQRFLQVSVHVMTRKQSVADQLKFHDPAVRNEIIRVLNKQDFNALRTKDGRLQLQKDLQAAVITLMKRDADIDDGIESVLLTDMVMQ